MTDMLGALAVALASALLALPLAAGAGAYRAPPDPITAMIDAAPTPTVVLSHDRRHIAAFDREGLPPVRALAQPILRLAGWRVNPRTQGPAEIRMNLLTGVTLRDVASGAAHAVSLPSGLRFTAPRWSPDDRHIAFVAEAPDGLELWVADAAGGPARRVSGPVLHAAFGVKLEWTLDSAAIVTLRKSPPAAPSPSQAIEGPTVQENVGRVASGRTYEDLLTGEADAALFERYFTCRLVRVDAATGAVLDPDEAGVISDFHLSPDGRFILVERLHTPWSDSVPSERFPTAIEIGREYVSFV